MLYQANEFSAFDAQKDLFDLLEGKRIFLSGGTGFFGKWLLKSFLYFNRAFTLNAGMTVLSRDPRAFLQYWPELKDEGALNFIQGDIRDFKFPSGKYDLMIHAASEVSTRWEQDNPQETHSVIVEGTRRMLDLAARAGTTRFMLTSSGAVYGEQPYEMSHLPETYAGAPVTAYGKAKLQAEQICVKAGGQYGFSVMLPRCFAFVGPYLNLDIHFAVGNFIRDCLEDRPIIIKGDGTSVRSYLYAADLVLWLWTILTKGVHARAYNVGSAQGISIKDLADRVRDCAKTSNPVEILGTAIPGVRPSRYVPSIERASLELNLRAHYSLNEAIIQTLAWYREGLK
jgi:nucleoside-diphosphate-sugar epimerase